MIIFIFKKTRPLPGTNLCSENLYPTETAWGRRSCYLDTEVSAHSSECPGICSDQDDMENISVDQRSGAEYK